MTGNMKKISFIIFIISVIFSSCENSNWKFSDYDYSTVYFAYQTPVRTITLGNDYVNDNSLDNEHKCQIIATVGGFREIKNDIEISFVVDNSLCDGLDNAKAMPSNYYTLSDNSKMIIKKGSKMIGGVVVQLADAFFADPLALSANYVIPLKMTGVKNADRILAGTAAEGISNPDRLVADDWQVLPKDYVLYAVKYINPWDVIYLRRGTDNITEDGVARTEKRQGNYSPEQDEIIQLNTISMTEIEFPVNNIRFNKEVNLNMTFKLDFDPNSPNSQKKCTFANGAWKDSKLVKEYNGSDFRITDIVVSGTGEYRKDGEKNSWGSKDRDALYLKYQVECKVEYPAGSPPKTVKYETEDVLVFRDRNVTLETFVPELK
jgi:hypothetical protein